MTVVRKLGGIGDRDAVGNEPWVPAHFHVEMLQRNRPTESRRRFMFDQRLEPVPVPQQCEHDEGENDSTRSEQRRGGKEWVRTCRSRCAPDHYKKKIQKKHE